MTWNVAAYFLLFLFSLVLAFKHPPGFLASRRVTNILLAAVKILMPFLPDKVTAGQCQTSRL